MSHKVEQTTEHTYIALCEIFNACFEGQNVRFDSQSSFGRLPDLTGMHWETSCSEKKFSLHCHIITEAFINIQEYKRFIESFIAFIEDNYR